MNYCMHRQWAPWTLSTHIRNETVQFAEIALIYVHRTSKSRMKFFCHKSKSILKFFMAIVFFSAGKEGMHTKMH